MRSDRNAPVDFMGCEQICDKSAAPEVSKFFYLLGQFINIINVKKLQFNQVLTATCIEWHIENSKNDKKVILAIITSPKRQCDAE